MLRQKSSPDHTNNVKSLNLLISLDVYFMAMEIDLIAGLVYVTIGFILTYLSLETAWHFTACKIETNGKNTVKPCIFKQMKVVALVR